jgi:hypothetical protein
MGISEAIGKEATPNSLIHGVLLYTTGRSEKYCCRALWRLILDPKERGGKLNEITISKDSSYPNSFYAYLLWVSCLKHQ